MYLLVVAAVIIDSYPLKYFWGVAREYLIPSSARILPPTLPISPYLSTLCVWPHRQVLALVFPRLLEFNISLGDWNQEMLSISTLPMAPLMLGPPCSSENPCRAEMLL